jgi:hypothetical protein
VIGSKNCAVLCWCNTRGAAVRARSAAPMLDHLRALPTLSEGGHCGLARLCIAVCRASILVVPGGQRPHPRRTDRASRSASHRRRCWCIGGQGGYLEASAALDQQRQQNNNQQHRQPDPVEASRTLPTRASRRTKGLGSPCAKISYSVGVSP